MCQQLKLFKTEEKNHHTAKSYKGIYGMHKYWSKKPYNIIRDFINKYSQLNDIIIDPFCGSGISVIEGVFTKRRSIGVDINPVAIFISRQLVQKIDVDKVFVEFEKIKKKIKGQIDSLYEIRRNGIIYYGTHFIWENEKLTEIWCLNGGRKKSIFEPIQEDIENAKKYKIKDISFFYPKDNFYQNSRINTKSDQKICDLFTPRNLFALSLLYNEILQIKDEKIKDIIKFSFTSSLGQSSKMVFIVKRRGKNKGNIVEKKEVGSWAIGYWTPKEYFEINVWKNFESRIHKVIKAKKQQYYADYMLSECKTVSEILNNKSNLCLINKPAQKVLTDIPDNSIDYVITDPPHGNRIPYLELSMLWNSWLKSKVNYKDEIIISNAKERGKDINDYNKLMNKVYTEIYRILKPGKFFSLMFNSLDDKTWINLILHINKLGFFLHSLDTLGYSANSIVQDNRKKGLKTDFILTFQKRKPSSKKIEILSMDNNSAYLNKEIKMILEENNNKEIYDILNKVFQIFLHKNQFFKLSDIIKIINKNER